MRLALCGEGWYSGGGRLGGGIQDAGCGFGELLGLRRIAFGGILETLSRGGWGVGSVAG